MTPKEKAQQLINAFIPHVRWKMGQEDVLKRAKECALIAVDEMIEIAEQYENALSISQTSDYPEFLKQLKQEIEKL